MRSTAPLVFLLAAACGTPSTAPAPAPAPPSILGNWTSTSPNASGTGFEFRADGTVTWTLSRAFEIQYRADLTTRPAKLDLFGFQGTPLDGRTLRCIIEITGDRLQMDCEPDAYPTAFDPGQTQAFVRAGP
jgi:hypothetical protein